jgi:RNA:NAD 2'-phosphotransferase (TPT1/KptA family)
VGDCQFKARQEEEEMKLFHGTSKLNWESIEQFGLKPNRIGIVYLSPKPKVAFNFSGAEILLEVETGNLKLTAFDDCTEWEVLCWGHIPPNNIKRIYFCDMCEQLFKSDLDLITHIHRDTECDNVIIHDEVI